MLEVMSEVSHTGGDNAIMLHCWEKSSPLIKELERTVNFAERKCGDLMQQLHYYKEYYEKWAHIEQTNNKCQKKKIKKCCKPLNAESLSENEFEKANQYFYNKIKSKITEMNNEIAQANRKLSYNIESLPIPPNDNLSRTLMTNFEDNKSQENISHLMAVENNSCKSETLVNLLNEKSQQSYDSFQPNELKISEKQSSKSATIRNKLIKKREPGQIKRRFNLQRYKIRSKSLPQGVKRKFGFGGFFEVFDPNMTHSENGSNHSRSKTSLRSESVKSRKSEGRSKMKIAESMNGFYITRRQNNLRSSRSLHTQYSHSKSDVRLSTRNSINSFEKNLKCNPTKTCEDEEVQGKTTISQSNLRQKSRDGNSCKAIEPSSSSVKSQLKNNINTDSKTIIMNQNLSHLVAKPNILIPFLRQPIPFIPCSSTSKTFNLGLNIQQVLSLIKHRRHSITLQSIVKNGMQAARSITPKGEPALSTLYFNQTTSHSHVESTLCPAREVSEECFSVLTENLGCRSKCSILKQVETTRSHALEEKKIKNFMGEIAKLKQPTEVKKVDRPEDVWVVEQPDSNSKNVTKEHTRCTCFPSRQCVDYHKVLRQYTGWRLPSAKAESFVSDSASSLGQMLPCTKSKLYCIRSRENIDFGMGESEGKIELVKVQNDLVNLNRKYSSLQEQIMQNNLDDYQANAELDLMESELAVKEVELKDILNFYNQLMDLKEKLKSLRTRKRQGQSTIQQPHCQRPKKDPLRPTPSMALTKVLRKIQGLQDKIKLIDAP